MSTKKPAAKKPEVVPAQGNSVKPSESPKISDVKSFDAQLKKDYKEVHVWEDPALGQIYARVTGEVDVKDDFSGKDAKAENTRQLAVTEAEFKDPSFYGLFKNRLGM